MDPGQRRLAERRLLAAMRRLHRKDPLAPDVRIDVVLAELRADPGERMPGGHRGGGSLAEVGDSELIAVLDELAAKGALARSGRQVRLSEHAPTLADREMRERVDRLLDELRIGGASPPRAESIAARVGVPVGLLESLRASGQLVHLADGIDYPRDVLEELDARLSSLAERGPVTVSRVRDGLGTTRRYAEALIAPRRTHLPNRRAPSGRNQLT